LFSDAGSLSPNFEGFSAGILWVRFQRKNGNVKEEASLESNIFIIIVSSQQSIHRAKVKKFFTSQNFEIMRDKSKINNS
jgi:hypothetical protein